MKGVALTRRRLVEILITGLTGGAAGASIMLAARIGIDAGDLLGFLGTAVGASLTIAGAVWVEDRKRAQARSDRLALIAQPLELALELLETESWTKATTNIILADGGGEIYGLVSPLRQEQRVMDRVVEQLDAAAALAADTTPQARLQCYRLRYAARARLSNLAGHEQMITAGHLKVSPAFVDCLVEDREPLKDRIRQSQAVMSADAVSV